MNPLNNCKLCGRQPTICRIGSDGWDQRYTVQIACKCDKSQFAKGSNDALAYDRWNALNANGELVLVG